MSVENWAALGSGEHVVWEGRPRITLVLPAVGLGLGLVAVAVWLAVSIDQPLFLAAVAIGFAIPLATYLYLVHTHFAVTNRACYRKTGVLARNVQRIALTRVQNSEFRQGIVGTRFGYGTVSIEAAGSGELAFNDVHSPHEVRALVDRHVDGDELPGSQKQWRAVLAEVRGIRTAFEESVFGG